MTALAPNSFPKAIHIPVELRGRPINSMPTSVRLANVLKTANIRVLGDLHGRKLDDFVWKRNCGTKTLKELDILVRKAQASPGDTEAASFISENGASFVVPGPVRQLRFTELPTTQRLGHLVEALGIRTLGELQERSASE